MDFISATLPPDRQILAIFGLAALDGGLVLWLVFFISGAKGAMQRGIALLMVVIDFLGCVAIFTLDTLLRTGQAGMTGQLTPAAIQTAVLALSLVIALNIAAVVGTHLTDQETRRGHMVQEEARDTVEDLAIKQSPKTASAWPLTRCLRLRLRGWTTPRPSTRALFKSPSAARRPAPLLINKNLDVAALPALEGSQECKPYKPQWGDGEMIKIFPKTERTCARCGRRFMGALRARWRSAACKQAAYRERRDRKNQQVVTIKQ